jgi:hypothetical protein
MAAETPATPLHIRLTPHLGQGPRGPHPAPVKGRGVERVTYTLNVYIQGV